MFNYKKGEPMLIPVELIDVNPDQPRKNFETAELSELCDSIKEFGIIQPLIVKKSDKGSYILIAGERRLRAGFQVGLTSVPCIVREASTQDSALIALIENVQRSDLSYIEEAVAYKRLISDYGLTQTEIARKVGKRQSTISNKLRLLSLPEDIRTKLAENKLTERHARALLRIEDNELRLSILNRIIKNSLNVTQSEKLISDVLEKQEEQQVVSKERVRYINYKLYVNTIKKAFACISDSEKDAKFYQEEKEDCVEVRIVIPKNSRAPLGTNMAAININ